MRLWLAQPSRESAPRVGPREALLLAASGLVALLGAELVCALVAPSTRVRLDLLGRRPIEVSGACFEERESERRPVRWPRPGCVARHRLLGDYDVEYRFDAHGLRLPAPEGRPRLLLLGDSQTFGQGVAEDETFAARLAAPLEAATGLRPAVLNAGVPGYGTFEMLARARALLPALRPDWVIVTVFVDNALVPDEGNDLCNNLAWLRAGTPGAPAGLDAHRRRPRSAWLADHSHLYGLLALAKRRLQGQPDHLEAVRRALRAPPPPERAEVWQATRGALRELDALARAHGARGTLVLHLPGLASLTAGDRSALDELRGCGLPVMSAFDRLAAAGDTRGLRHRHDTHYNARAHALVSAALAEELAGTLP